MAATPGIDAARGRTARGIALMGQSQRRPESGLDGLFRTLGEKTRQRRQQWKRNQICNRRTQTLGRADRRYAAEYVPGSSGPKPLELDHGNGRPRPKLLSP